MRILTKFILCTLTIVQSSHAVDVPRKIHFSSLEKIADYTLNIKIEAQGIDNTYWQLSPSDIAVFYAKLKDLEKSIEAYSPLVIPKKDTFYEGLLLTVKDKEGRNLIPIHIYKGRIEDERGNLMAIDPMRYFEYWLWSTGAPENLNTVHTALPIIDFNQCISLGHRIVETAPRQCLLANGDIFLDVMEQPTQESLSITSFDECLVNGEALINTFPRRCIAAGGHVFTEPPRLKETKPVPGLQDLGVKEFSIDDFQ